MLPLTCVALRYVTLALGWLRLSLELDDLGVAAVAVAGFVVLFQGKLLTSICAARRGFRRDFYRDAPSGPRGAAAVRLSRRRAPVRLRAPPRSRTSRLPRRRPPTEAVWRDPGRAFDAAAGPGRSVKSPRPQASPGFRSSSRSASRALRSSRRSRRRRARSRTSTSCGAGPGAPGGSTGPSARRGPARTRGCRLARRPNRRSGGGRRSASRVDLSRMLCMLSFPARTT